MPKKVRSKRLLLSVSGRVVEAVTIKGLANILGKSTNCIRSYETKGIFPPAPLYSGRYRCYPVKFAQELALLVKEFPPNRPPDAELITRVTKLFKEEKNKYATEK